MTILDRYIGRSFLVAVVTTVFVFTFVMSVGGLFRVNELLARGVAWGLIGRVFVWGIPSILVFALPISILTAALLVFGRISHDGEITAMKACGVSLWRVMAMPLAVGAGLSAACLYVNAVVAPRGHYEQRRLVNAISADAALSLLDEGVFVRDFPGLSVWIGRRTGNQVKDVIIYDLTGKRGTREIRAAAGNLRFSEDRQHIVIDLEDVRVDPFYEDRPGPGYAERWPIMLSLEKVKRRQISRRIADFSLRELLQAVATAGAPARAESVTQGAVARMPVLVEIHKRLSLSVSCLAFAMLGVPLGIRAHRRESSVSVIMSLLLAALYYLCIVMAGSLQRRDELHPYLFVWIPIVICGTVGPWLVRRCN